MPVIQLLGERSEGFTDGCKLVTSLANTYVNGSKYWCSKFKCSCKGSAEDKEICPVWNGNY